MRSEAFASMVLFQRSLHQAVEFANSEYAYKSPGSIAFFITKLVNLGMKMKHGDKLKYVRRYGLSLLEIDDVLKKLLVHYEHAKLRYSPSALEARPAEFEKKRKQNDCFDLNLVGRRRRRITPVEWQGRAV